MNKKRQQILKWQQQGLIKQSDIEQALVVTDAGNSAKQWLDFMTKSLLWLGVLAVAFGVIFFFAYNWENISKLQKFTLIQGLMLVGVFCYSQSNKLYTKTALLFFLAILIGSLFALFGQTYQTGKDPWQLFFLWTVFITPLAFIAKSTSLWLLWLGLANLTLSLVLDVHYGVLGMIFDGERGVLVFAGLNTLAAIGFELLFKYKLIINRIAAQVAIIAAMLAFTWVAIDVILDFYRNTKEQIDIVYYMFWMGLVYYFYRKKTLDVLVLASWVVSGGVAIVALLARISEHSFDSGTLLLIMGLATIGLSTIGIRWLMGLLKEVKTSGEVA
ncbi:MAG: DUF2157 domain-containing protein [Proteobacteria bacterium]|nr:DUF2157 domain-containing protein [Pseudomonadota bacterium]